MPERDIDYSMLVYGAMGTELADEPTALALAEMLIRRIYGDNELGAQQPLQVTDGDDRWIVVGSKVPSVSPSANNEVIRGRILVEILKANCQVLRFEQQGYLPPLPS